MLLTAPDTVEQGSRHDRSELFRSFDLTGRRVLDFGCDLGELSRRSRERGAAMVDGVDSDGRSVQIARFINAYRGVTKVSVSQGDLTNPETIRRRYDVALCFSEFPYVLPVLDKLAANTREALILEFHDMTTDLRSLYIDPISRYFPHHTFVRYSDFDRENGRRAVFVFAKNPETLVSGRLMRSTVDIPRSDFRYDCAIRELIDRIVPGQVRNRHDIEHIVNRTGGVPDDLHLLVAGRTYWLEMMKGYLQFRQAGRVTAGNSYVKLVRKALADYGFDHDLAAALSSERALIAQVKFRFADINLLAEGNLRARPIDPITIAISGEADSVFSVHHGETGATIRARQMDGYHRVFWAIFFGLAKLPALYSVYPI